MQRQIEDMKEQYVQDIANLSSEMNMKLSKDDLDTLESKFSIFSLVIENLFELIEVKMSRMPSDLDKYASK
jgi:hypothetical protein